MLRYFSLHIEPLNNNGVRFTVGALVLVFVGRKYHHEFVSVIKTPKLLGFAVLVGIMMCANMFFGSKAQR